MNKRASGSAATRCFYCGSGLLKAATRTIVVHGRTVRVHLWHPRRPGEVAGK